MEITESFQMNFLPKGICLTCCYPVLNTICWQALTLPLVAMIVLYQIAFIIYKSYSHLNGDDGKAIKVPSFIDLEDESMSNIKPSANSEDDFMNSYTFGLNKKKCGLNILRPEAVERVLSEEIFFVQQLPLQQQQQHTPQKQQWRTYC